MSSAKSDVAFRFGRNWSRFLRCVDESRVERAVASLVESLGDESIHGKSFLDLGSGSGLFSLAARRLGARVLSVDVDPECVACAEELKRRFAPGDDQWRMCRGSALDGPFLQSLGAFDVVYSWGVLHHTGDMARALENAIDRVADPGRFAVAIYNDQGRASRTWTRIKRLYNKTPRALRFLILGPAFVRIWGPTMVRDALRLKPFHTWRTYDSVRGMSAWTDLVDWVGGYPFEVAKPEEILAFGRRHGFELTFLRTCGGGRGCNEFVFRRERKGARSQE